MMVEQVGRRIREREALKVALRKTKQNKKGFGQDAFSNLIRTFNGSNSAAAIALITASKVSFPFFNVLSDLSLWATFLCRFMEPNGITCTEGYYTPMSATCSPYFSFCLRLYESSYVFLHHQQKAK